MQPADLPDGPSTVDSRAYAYAYVIREFEDVPGDFAESIAPLFFLGLYLPQGITGRFNTPAYPARVLLLAGDELILYVHPSLHAPPLSVSIGDVRVVSWEKFLLDCRFSLDRGSSQCEIQYSARNGEPVAEFFGHVRGRPIPANYGYARPRSILHVGDPLDLKFASLEGAGLAEEEGIRARLFISAQSKIERRWLGTLESWTPADYLAVTDRRLLWMTDRQGEYRQTFDDRCAYLPLAYVRNVGVRKNTGLVIEMQDEITWTINLPSQHINDALKFADKVSRQCNPGSGQQRRRRG